MRQVIPFDEKEMKVAGSYPNILSGDMFDIYTYPVTPKENYLAAMEGHPYWQPLPCDYTYFAPPIVPDNCCRAFLFCAEDVGPEQYGGKDMFGVDWEFVEAAGGSMVRPGKPMLEDVNDWKSVLKFPDLDSWDWEGSSKKNWEEWYPKNKDLFIVAGLNNGCWFERLISLMDFEAAALAVIDEEQEEALQELFTATTDLYIKLIDKHEEYFGFIDAYNVHDDWGSQMAPFFSDEVARKFFLPQMKRLVDHIKSKGKVAYLHSCGHVEDRIDIFIEAGFQWWDPMRMNNTRELYHRVGDKILLSVHPDKVPEEASEEEHREAARRYVEEFCVPGKPSVLFWYGLEGMSAVYNEELYRQSRIAYSK